MGSRFWGNAWLLLALANLFWAGNVIIGRAVSADIPPITFTAFRWGGAFLLALPLAWPHLRRDLPVLLRRWPYMVMMGLAGYAIFNAMSYHGMHDTTALNALLMQSAMPLLVLLWMFALFGERPGPLQVVGVALSIGGVIAIATRGTPSALARLALNSGDVWVLSGLVLYSLYSAQLRRRPSVHPLSFLAVAFGIATLFLVPLALIERAAGNTVAGGIGSALAILYTATLPSFVSTLFFNRGVELVGPSLSGQSAHLIPLFGSVMAVALLGEQFRPYHAVGIVLIGAGIVLASRGRPVTGSPPGRTRAATLTLVAGLTMSGTALAADPAPPPVAPPPAAQPAPSVPPQPNPAQPAQSRTAPDPTTAPTPAPAPAPPPQATPKPVAPMPHPPPAQVQPMPGESMVAVLGSPVFGPDKKEMVGHIVDVLVDQEGRPEAAVIDVGGFLGLGSRQVAVDWSSLHFLPADHDHPILLTLTADQIKAAPAYHEPAAAAPIAVVKPAMLPTPPATTPAATAPPPAPPAASPTPTPAPTPSPPTPPATTTAPKS